MFVDNNVASTYLRVVGWASKIGLKGCKGASTWTNATRWTGRSAPTAYRACLYRHCSCYCCVIKTSIRLATGAGRIRTWWHRANIEYTLRSEESKMNSKNEKKDLRLNQQLFISKKPTRLSSYVPHGPTYSRGLQAVTRDSCLKLS
jgi:hypothetical protein